MGHWIWSTGAYFTGTCLVSQMQFIALTTITRGGLHKTKKNYTEGIMGKEEGEYW